MRKPRQRSSCLRQVADRRSRSRLFSVPRRRVKLCSPICPQNWCRRRLTRMLGVGVSAIRFTRLLLPSSPSMDQRDNAHTSHHTHTHTHTSLTSPLLFCFALHASICSLDTSVSNVAGSPEFVRWVAQDHFRPCVSLQRSPFFPDIILRYTPE
jgi:hypothetical protein